MTISNEIPVYPRRFPDWQKEFEAVLTEADSDKLPRLFEVAEAAIFLRLQALTFSSSEYAERSAISDALRRLGTLKSEKFHISEISSLPIIKQRGRRQSAKNRLKDRLPETTIRRDSFSYR